MNLSSCHPSSNGTFLCKFCYSTWRIPIGEIFYAFVPSIRTDNLETDEVHFETSKDLCSAKPPSAYMLNLEKTTLKTLDSNLSIVILFAHEGTQQSFWTRLNILSFKIVLIPPLSGDLTFKVEREICFYIKSYIILKKSHRTFTPKESNHLVFIHFGNSTRRMFLSDQLLIWWAFRLMNWWNTYLTDALNAVPTYQITDDGQLVIKLRVSADLGVMGTNNCQFTSLKTSWSSGVTLDNVTVEREKAKKEHVSDTENYNSFIPRRKKRKKKRTKQKQSWETRTQVRSNL